MFFLGIVAVFLCSSSTWAQGGGGPKPPRPPCLECGRDFLSTLPNCREIEDRRERRYCQRANEREYRNCRKTCGRELPPRVLDERESPEVTALPIEAPTQPILTFEDLVSSDSSIEVSVHVDTQGEALAFTDLTFGVSSLENDVLEVMSVVAGPGLLAYVAENGDPPDCDIVIYPSRQAAVGSITKLLTEIPYNSDLYGTEFLQLEYKVVDIEARSVNLQLFSSDDLIVEQESVFVQVSGLKTIEISILPAEFIRGDGNDDSVVDLTDALVSLGYIFLGEGVACVDALDINDDNELNITDPVYLLSGLFNGGFEIATTCDYDYTVDPLICESYTSCLDP